MRLQFYRVRPLEFLVMIGDLRLGGKRNKRCSCKWLEALRFYLKWQGT